MADSDYTSTSVEMVFPAGSSPEDAQCVNITITDDTVFEEEEHFTVALTTSDTAVVLGHSNVVITITDNEG